MFTNEARGIGWTDPQNVARSLETPAST